MTNPAKNIWEIRELLGLKQSERGYQGTFSTGAFDQLFDYDAGILFVAMRRVPAKPYSFMMSISTVDDGVWQAEDSKQDYTEEEADQRTEEITKAFLEFQGGSTKLPSEKDLNQFLQRFGIWGTYTG